MASASAREKIDRFPSASSARRSTSSTAGTDPTRRSTSRARSTRPPRTRERLTTLGVAVPNTTLAPANPARRAAAQRAS